MKTLIENIEKLNDKISLSEDLRKKESVLFHVKQVTFFFILVAEITRKQKFVLCQTNTN